VTEKAQTKTQLPIKLVNHLADFGGLFALILIAGCA
jgi:hypothetical protein